LIDQNDLDEFLCSQKQSEDAGHEREAPRPLQVKQEAITEEAPDTEDTSTERTVVFSRKDAAILLGVHPDTINRWRRQGRLHATSEGEIPLAEIKRLTSATIPISETQLELLKDPVSQESTQAEKGLPPWFVLARLLEASQEREVKLGQQLEVLHALLLRMTDLLGARSIGQSVYARPMDVSVTDRILTFLQAYPGPHRGTEVRDALSLPDIPTDTLQRLVERGLVKRLSPGLFEATSDPSESGPPLEPAEGTLMAKVLAYVRETTGEGSMRRGVRSWQVQQALNLPESPNRTLSRLRARGLIYRIREGIYSSKPLGANEEEENVE
jgi:hypothetical protein